MTLFSSRSGGPPENGAETPLRVLLIDNYDSYTYNLAQLLAANCACELTVLQHDDPALLGSGPGDFDCVVISPGPGRPQRAPDIIGIHDARCAYPDICHGHAFAFQLLVAEPIEMAERLW